jgi:hypothetical protein
MQVGIFEKDNRIGRIRVFFLLTAFSVFATGVLIYSLFRNADLVIYKLLKKPDFLIGLYLHFPVGNCLIDFAVYSVPDGLWLLSCILCLRALWLENTEVCGLYVFITCIVAAIFEVCQMFNVLPGTFDIFDLCAMGLAAFGEGVFYTSFLRRRIPYAYQS